MKLLIRVVKLSCMNTLANSTRRIFFFVINRRATLEESSSIIVNTKFKLFIIR